MGPVEQQEPSNECLLRIQNEISEVEKRELELRNEHALISPSSPTTNGTVTFDVDDDPLPADVIDVRPTSPQNICSKDHFKKNKIIEPQPKPQMHQLLTAPPLSRALSQPQLFNISPVKISSPHKGIMQKFIASRGKLNVGQVNQPAPTNNFKKNLIMAPIEFNSDSIKAFQNFEKALIERDKKGKPIRRGYVPVEEKIQTELRDLKNRETELKRLHKINVRDFDDEITPDEIDSSDWSPINGKLSKSIDALNSHSSPSPTIESSKPIPTPRNTAIRPAVSLATLINLEPEMEAPSSHKLIERWEHIIQENQQRERSYNIN
ncbi:unnamed protein product [Chironomus riparius]|uniref:A-kinase anchor protein 2 C-terminal domain-containing protein n=1 Tax=Chironomus riparius TaxID=315576 RepID=A0A9N9S7Z1_9DIPT|nr:unnamed protein product [Chironomus riparius]